MTDWQPGEPLYDRNEASAAWQRWLLEVIPEHDCQPDACDGQVPGLAARWPKPFDRHELQP